MSLVNDPEPASRSALFRLTLETAELEPLYSAAGRLMVMPAALDQFE